MKELSIREPLAYHLLTQDLKNNRLSQCYLFTGENSPLKQEMAENFAAAILAGKQEWLSSTDDFLHRVKNHKHFDFYFLSGREESLKSEKIEELQKELWKTALEKGASRKVFIIDNIDNASIKVYNQLLKFIEETPGDSTFGILLTDNVDSLLPTITSRCVRVPFRFSSYLLTSSRYQEYGFEKEESYFLSFAYPQYKEIELNDVNYLAAMDAREMTLASLIDDVEYIPYYLQHCFAPAFKSEEEKKGDFKEASRLYLMMLSLLCKEALAPSLLFPTEKLKNIHSFGAEALYDLCEEMLEILPTVDTKLLLDRFAYRLFCIGGK